MPYIRDDQAGTDSFALQDFEPTFGQSLSATVDETLAGNPTSVLYNVADFARANAGPSRRLSAYDAGSIIKESGVVGLSAEDGEYNEEALRMLIERKRQEMIRADVLSRTEYSMLGTPARFSAMLGASVIDPLNIASAFVPVVGQARVASVLGRTAAGSLARAGARAQIGAVEGLAGAAMIEPFLQIGRTELQDDYDMSDSLLNIAFGGALGGGLHVVGGQAADLARASDPYARFAGLDAAQARTVLDFERNPPASPSDVAAEVAGWTPQMRRAVGYEDPQPVLDTTAPDVPQVLSREDFARLAQEYPREVLTSIAERVARREMPELPFAKLSDTTPDSARQTAARELADALRAELLPVAGNRAAPGEVAALRQELEALNQRIGRNNSQFKELAKRYQSEGMTRKKAEAAAKKEMADTEAELVGQRTALEAKIERNRLAANAEEEIAALKRGEIPERFEERIRNRANQILAQADIARAALPPARTVIEAATPQARQAAFRSAIAQAVNGRMPDVDLLLRKDATFQQLKAVADRQANADSLLVGDKRASDAATGRLKQAIDEGLSSAEAELNRAMQRIDQLRENLELGGMKKEATSRLMNALKPFEDAMNDADAYGRAARAAAVCGVRG